MLNIKKLLTKILTMLNDLNSNIANTSIVVTKGSKISSFISDCRKIGAVCYMSGFMEINNALNMNDVIITLTGVSASIENTRIPFYKDDGSGKMFFAKIDKGSNQVRVDSTLSGTAAENYYLFNFVIIVE